MFFIKKIGDKTFTCLLIILISINYLFSQSKITEYDKSLLTYDFSDPNPIPILSKNPKIYPYFTFDGYDLNSEQKKFKIIELENDYVQVFVMPEVGGKVWGAIEKSTGNEFIYRNEVVKYRNISMRGPWTSGGIEFNFGLIGHHPSTATPVDYVIKENEDGSVSCIVGNIDLPSRTQWRVKINLPKDYAGFFTEAVWYNPTPLHQSYYNWMTAAAPASNDLEFFTPGNAYLEHSGESKNWPINEEGKNLSKYNQNNFGPSKSYHVVGEFNDFFGGYYKKSGYGYGHWGNYEDIPGQKLWLWSQSRSGGIWEDLLTDTDGQYIEFQAGRLLVQYLPSGDVNPISNVSFEPNSIDIWQESWFPVKEIGGISDASQYGAIYIIRDEDSTTLNLNPFIDFNGKIQILLNDKKYLEENVNLKPMDVYRMKFKINEDINFRVKINDLKIDYETINKKLIKRSFSSNTLKIKETNQSLFNSAIEDISYRDFDKAKEKLKKIIEVDPYHTDAISYLGEIHYRNGEYKKAIDIIYSGLSIDTYNPSLNYIAGIIYKEIGDYINSKESLGWASRSIKYRSNALSKMAELSLIEKDYETAISYSNKSLQYNSNNISSLEVLAISNRLLSNKEDHQKILAKIESIDPIHHILSFEKFLMDPSEINKTKFINSHRSELRNETFLELSIRYFNLKQTKEAQMILENGPRHLTNDLWISYISNNKDKLDNLVKSNSINFIFPFRRETIKVLEWAKNNISNWKVDYLLALNLWSKGRHDESQKLFKELGDVPKNENFYLSRASLIKNSNVAPYNDDIKKAYMINKKNWRAVLEYGRSLQNSNEFSEARKVLRTEFERNKSNYMIGMEYIKVLLNISQYEKAIDILENLKILPYEHAGEGRELYEKAYFNSAINKIDDGKIDDAIKLIIKSKLWPEELGVGKPYKPDERIQNFLLYICYKKLGKPNHKFFLEDVVSYSKENIDKINLNYILGYEAIKESKGEELANKFIDQIKEIKKNNLSEVEWLIKYSKTQSLPSEKKFDMIKSILKLK